MAKRRTSDFEDLLDALALLPWWVSVGFAGFVFVLLSAVDPALPFTDPALKGIAATTPSFAWVALIFLLPAAMSAWNAFFDGRQLDRQQSLESIRNLTWKQFEELVAEAYRRRGFAVRVTPDGADGGVDLIVSREGRTYLVQCKHWKTAKVGVTVVREMLGLVTAHRATGAVILTTGAFTQEAEAFSVGQPVELLDGSQVFAFVREAQAARRGAVQTAPVGVAQTAGAEACPQCGSPLVRRRAKRGPNAGGEFWGCSSFPQCKYTRNI